MKRAFSILTALILTSALATSVQQVAAQDDSSTVGLQLIAEGFTSPVAMVAVPDGTGRLFIVDQIGLVHILMPDGTMLDQPFLDVRSKLVALDPGFDERGLLGLAFHPNYAENGRFFVYYSAPLREEAPDNFNCTTTISEFHVSDDPN